MPDSPVGSQTCGTGAPGTLFGGHPTDIGIEVTRTVNFESFESKTWRSIDTKVVNCGSFFVYYLKTAPGCHLGYCGQ